MPTVLSRVAIPLLAAPLMFAGLLTGCAADSAVAPDPTPPAAKLPSANDEKLVGKSATLLVHGLACPSCAKGVETQLRQTAGVKQVTLDTSSGFVALELDPDRPPTRTDIRNAVKYGGAILVELRQP